MALFGKKNKEEIITESKPQKLMDDVLAPAAINIAANYAQIGEKYSRTLFMVTYPRFLNTNWFSPIVNLDQPLDVSIFVHPQDTGIILKKLRDRLGRFEAQAMEDQSAGKVRDPIMETAINDIENLRDKLQQGTDKFFELGLYVTIYGESVKELDETENKIRGVLDAQLVYSKEATFRMKEGFLSTLPLNDDKLNIHTSLNTEPVSSLFPFVSYDLTSDKGILYGINTHNNSLVLFDRFSLENYNMVVFGKSGGGKSLDKNEKVMCKEGEVVQILKIGSLIEKLIKKHGITKIDEELEGVIDPGIKVWAFDKNLKGSWNKVSVAARKAAPDYFYRIRTRSGRKITTTGDHNMVTLNNGLISIMKSDEIKAGQYLPLPRHVQPAKKIINNLNLSEVLDNFGEFHFENGYIISRFGKNRLPVNLPANESLFKLFGYIVSEGTVTDTCVAISNTDQEVIKDIEKAYKEIGISFSTNNFGVRTCNRIFIELIKKLGAKKKSGKKRVLPIIFSSNIKPIASFISAYFEGDGTVSHNGVYAVSKSKELVSDFSYLFYYFGIISRISPCRKKAPGWKRKKTYWKLMISGQDNLRKFAADIGFVSKRKQELLTKLLGKKENSNVDVIPGLSGIFKEIYELFPWQNKMDSPDIIAIKNGVYDPSPENLKLIIEKIRGKLAQYMSWGQRFKPLYLPSLNSIIRQSEIDKEFNHKLWQTLGSSWAVMKKQSVEPRIANVLEAVRIVSPDFGYSANEIKKAIHFGFNELGLSIKEHNRSLQEALVYRSQGNTSYEMLRDVSQYIINNYREGLNNLGKLESLLNRLEILASSDLFWDPIVKVEKIKNKKDKYVYDLTVDNEVFLAGTGGMFVHNSYTVKLEILRSLMLGTQVFVIDPENEFKFLADTVGGTSVKISISSDDHINPFDLPKPLPDENPADVLRSHVLNLTGLLRLMMGSLNSEEEAIMDEALNQTYAIKDITPTSDFANSPPPSMSDLLNILEGMTGTQSLVTRLRKYTEGSFAGFLNNPTNVRLDNQLVVFGIRDMEEELRPIAMYLVLNYIWAQVRTEIRKRLLVIDEAWVLLKYEVGGSFVLNIAKRARKYYLGLTTISQDIPDFMNSAYGKPIVTNSSLQLLLRQSPASIDQVQQTFNLTDAEKFFLLESRVGHGLFFAGQNHVALRVIASYAEDQIITSDPRQIMEIEEAKKELAK